MTLTGQVNLKQEASDSEEKMEPPPQGLMAGYLAAGKLKGKKALITGGDSGIGRAVAIAFAKEGADVAIVYLKEDEDARLTRKYVEVEGRECLLFSGDIGKESFCKLLTKRLLNRWTTIDILVNNAAEQHPHKNVKDVSPK